MRDNWVDSEILLQVTWRKLKDDPLRSVKIDDLVNKTRCAKWAFFIFKYHPQITKASTAILIAEGLYTIRQNLDLEK